jgi:hypothetical protein
MEELRWLPDYPSDDQAGSGAEEIINIQGGNSLQTIREALVKTAKR